MTGRISKAEVKATGTTTPRSLADRFSDLVNIKDFGAVCDGVTDDTQSLQEAINNANGRKVVFSGPLRITDTIELPDNTYLEGLGDAWIIKDFVSTGVNRDAVLRNSTYSAYPSGNKNIHLRNFAMASRSPSNLGAFISINWVEFFSMHNVTISKDTVGSCAHLNVKNAIISNCNIDGSQASSLCDGLHFEYSENVVVSDCNIYTEDDAIAFAPYPESWTSYPAPNLQSKNITISNCVANSKIANGFRITCGFIGDQASSNTVGNKVSYVNVVVDGLVVEKTGATGRAISVYDERDTNLYVNDNIQFSNIIVKDDTSVTGSLRVRGNVDYTDNSNTRRNFNNVSFSNCTFVDSTQGLYEIGGVSSIDFRDCNFINSGVSQNLFDIRNNGKVKFIDCTVETASTVRAMRITNFEELIMKGNDIVGSAVNALTLESPTVGVSLIDLSYNNIRGFSNFGNTLSPITPTYLYNVDNKINGGNKGIGNVVGTSESVIYEASEVISSVGTTGAGVTASGTVQVTIKGITYNILVSDTP